jgi:protein-disulfide isomerase
MKRFLPFVIVGVVAIAAVGGGTALYRSKRSALRTVLKENYEPESVSDSVHVLGPADALITLEEFGDFQCPPCGKLSEPINGLRKDYKLRVIYREFPLPMHAHAREAALAAEAAGRQGKFWPMHDLLYQEQDVWAKSTDARARFNSYAQRLGLDLSRFDRDVDSQDVKEQVELDQRRGAVIGVKNTPTIFLNNEAVAPNRLNPSDLRVEVETAVKNAKPSS